MDTPNSSEVFFDRDKLRQLIVHNDAVPPVDSETVSVLLMDCARSSGPKSDETAILAARIKTTEPKTYFIEDVIADRFEIVEIPYQVVKAAQRHTPSHIKIERLQNWELLQAEIIRLAVEWQINLGCLSFFKPSKKKAAKSLRIRNLHALCEVGAVRFVSGNYVEKLFTQLCNFDFESATNKGRADDVADSASLLVTHF